MTKINWQLIGLIFGFLSVIGIVVTASSPFFTQAFVSDLDLYEHYAISSEREVGKNYRLKWSFRIHSDSLFIATEPHVTMLILTEDNYHLLLANDSSAIINLKREFTLNIDKGEFKIPSKDIWVIVFNNTNYSIMFGDAYADYSITMNTNFYNLPLVISLIPILAVCILFGFITPIAIAYISSKKQIKLDDEKQQQEEEAQTITLSTSEMQEKLDLLNSIRQHYDRLPTHILMHMLRFDSFRELMIWCETLPPELRFTYDKSEVVFLKEQTLGIEEKPISQPIIENLSKDNKYLCSNCGNEVSYIQNKCSNCGEIARCVVCKLQIDSNDQKCKCPLCETVGHLIHFHLWVDGINKCPFCKEKLTISDIVLLVEEE